MAESARRFPWRAWLRAVHRDAGYIAVGLTVVYALSGLAVNHISDWDPNFQSYERTHELGGPIEGDDQRVAALVLSKLEVTEAAQELYRASP